MFYKETKYLAAHKVLSILNSECVIITKVDQTHLFAPSYKWTNLQVIKERAKLFDIETLRDAAWLLKKENEIDILDNQNHIYDIQLKIDKKGLERFKEKAYLWKFILSWKTIILGVVAIIGGVLGIIKLLYELNL